MTTPETSRTVSFLGDSHTKYFTYAARKGYLGERRTASCVVFGATASGLANPKSQTGALLQFRDFLTEQPDKSILVIHLGEVDCGFVIWYRAQKYAESVERQMDQAIGAYCAFIDEIRANYRHTIIVTAATLPTIRDNTDWGEVAHLRREVTASLADRTRLTHDFNAELRKRCADRSIRYLDITAALLDPRTGVVADRFRNPDPADHHLNKRIVSPLWADALNPALSELGA